MKTRICEDCGEPTAIKRYRCKNCNKLVCSWCYYHVHKLPMFHPALILTGETQR